MLGAIGGISGVSLGVCSFRDYIRASSIVCLLFWFVYIVLWVDRIGRGTKWFRSSWEAAKVSLETGDCTSYTDEARARSKAGECFAEGMSYYVYDQSEPGQGYV